MNYERLGRKCRFWKEAKGNEFPCEKRGCVVICPPGPVTYKCWENGPGALVNGVNEESIATSG